MRDSKAEMVRREKLQAALQELRKKKGVSGEEVRYSSIYLAPSCKNGKSHWCRTPNHFDTWRGERGCLFMPGIAGDGFRNDQRNGRCHCCWLPYNQWQRQPIQWTACFHSTLQPFLNTRLFHPLQSPEMSVSPQQWRKHPCIRNYDTSLQSVYSQLRMLQNLREGEYMCMQKEKHWPMMKSWNCWEIRKWRKRQKRRANKEGRSRNLSQPSHLKTVMTTQTTVLSVVVCTLTPKCVSGLVAIPATDGFISSVRVSKGFPRSQNNLCATFAKVNNLSLWLCFQTIFIPWMCITYRF